ncbi:MAG: radical SAM family heme chaperone HemW [Candidatus Omnitrophica bacterium]|nr:radical SAM family heme chaperone HemW [Candidatus Omnitrophota bacterium]
MGPALYIHIPFCKRKCIYCNFYSRIYDAASASAFTDILISQVERIKGPLHSIYIGGGTPSALDRKIFEKLLARLKDLTISSGEFTVEVNPESLDDEKIKTMLGLGVNRLSIGTQSLDDRKLKKLGRLHSAARAQEAVLSAHKYGFKNISADLIFGVWGETPDSWKKELDGMVRLPIDHVSCYELTYEKGTPLYSAVLSKSVLPLDSDITSAMYEAAIDILGLRGFKQYEISNFAKEGCGSKHNMNYWDNNPYIGLGPSAVSYIDGVRSRNVSDVKEYMDRARTGRALTEFSEKLSPLKSAKETAAVKIRTRDGIGFDWFRAKTGFDLRELEKKALPKLIEDGFIKYKAEGEIQTGICLKRKGFLFCDTVSSALL